MEKERYFAADQVKGLWLQKVNERFQLTMACG